MIIAFDRYTEEARYALYGHLRNSLDDSLNEEDWDFDRVLVDRNSYWKTYRRYIEDIQRGFEDYTVLREGNPLYFNKDLIITHMLEISQDVLPLYINSPVPVVREVCKWRLAQC